MSSRYLTVDEIGAQDTNPPVLKILKPAKKILGTILSFIDCGSGTGSYRPGGVVRGGH